MELTKLILVLAFVGVSFGDSSKKTASSTERPKSWFNWWDYPVVGNSQSSGTWTPGPHQAAGQPGQGAQWGQGGQAAPVPSGGATISRNQAGAFQWFQNSAVDPNKGGDSSTIPPNKDLWANPDAGSNPVAQPAWGRNNQFQGGAVGNYFNPSGGYNRHSVDFEEHFGNHNSGENPGASGPMARPGGSGGVNQAAGGRQHGDQAIPRGGNNGAIPNLYNAKSANSAGGSFAAGGTLVGVALAVIVVVGVFAGAAYILKRQRRSNQAILANV